MTQITAFQRRVAATFFALPESDGFLVAGGAALIAAEVVDRPTDDLDLFRSRSGADIPATKDAFIKAAIAHSWAVEVSIDTPEFVRLVITAEDEELAVDFGVDADPLLPPTVTFLGPTIDVEDNAGRKILALFGRWMPRDFVDVYALSKRYDKQRLIELAAERDAGFDLGFFSQALAQVTSIRPDRFPIPADDLPAMIAFHLEWAAELGTNVK